MPEVPRTPFAYRTDPAVPHFDDGSALFVFDGACVLCSTGARWLMRYDRKGRVNFTSSKSPLGAALYQHFAIRPDDSYLLLLDGRAFTAGRGYLALCALLEVGWQALRLGSMGDGGVPILRWRSQGRTKPVSRSYI
jgi:predicted DCC family thiol-disulfide oxidoreductase YuxK